MCSGIVNLLSGLSSANLVCHTHHMRTPSINFYKNHRFPAEIISHGVWLYCRFCLSYRDVEELLFARGVMVTYETICQWYRKFGQAYANQLCHWPCFFEARCAMVERMPTPTSSPVAYPIHLISPSGLHVQVNAIGSIRVLDDREFVLNIFVVKEVDGVATNFFMSRQV
jgi:hypothetical protein